MRPASRDVRRNALPVLFALAVAMAGGGCGWIGDPDHRVLFASTPHDLERQYLHIARHIDSEKPCYLISRDSITVVGMGPRGSRAAYMRSTCFSSLAAITHNPELCREVVSVSTISASGHGRNRERCIEDARRGGPTTGTGAFDQRLLFQLAGWSDAHVDSLMAEHDILSNASYCLLHSREFFKAIESFPNFAAEEDLEKAKKVEWRPHPLLTLLGFPCTGKFL